MRIKLGESQNLIADSFQTINPHLDFESERRIFLFSASRIVMPYLKIRKKLKIKKHTYAHYPEG